MLYKKKQLCLLLLCCCIGRLCAQNAALLPADTVRISLDSTESRFINNNLQLLAQRYNVDVVKALEIQARLYPNPNFTIASTIYNPNAKKFFPAPLSPDGELSGNISQVIVLAGKINKNFRLAQANSRLSEYEFFDLLRTLKYSLRSTFYSIYYLQQSAAVYQLEISNLQVVVTAYNDPDVKKYISEKEVVRVKAQLYSLQNEYQGLIDQINDAESQLRLLVREKAGTYMIPQLDDKKIESDNPLQYPLAVLVDSAYKGRTDLMIAKANTNISKLNYTYQKALAVPDLTASVSYDQQGSYIHNYSALGLAIDLPFFSRNQGNIKSAKAAIKMNEATEQSTQLTVEENVYRALQKAIDADNLYKKIDPAFGQDYTRLVTAAVEHYKRREMALLDFLDFYDSYKQTTLQVNAIKYNKINALEGINFYTGSSFF